MTHLDVIARNGVPFRAVIAPDRDEVSEATVSFYDRRYPHTEHGQFTGGRYYISTLLAGAVPWMADGDSPRGLDLNGGASGWSIDVETFGVILGWLRTRVETADLWDALHDNDNDLPGVIVLARRDGASWSFISHATQRSGTDVRRMRREETS